jgi:hypothetical protein
MNHSGNDHRDAQRGQTDADVDAGADAQARRERQQPTASRPGGFQNDPDDPTNPNEAIDRTRKSSLNPRRVGREDDSAR